MRETHFPFALIDPTSHLFMDANDPYAGLFELDASQIKGVSVISLYDPEVGTTIESFHGAFARGTLQIVRGQGSLRRSNGATIVLERLVETDRGDLRSSPRGHICSGYEKRCHSSRRWLLGRSSSPRLRNAKRLVGAFTGQRRAARRSTRETHVADRRGGPSRGPHSRTG
jgi:hypothetical protein